MRTAAAILAFFLSIFGLGAAVAETEQPKYEVLDKAENYELRGYQSMIVAEVTVGGARSEAVSAGFRLLAAYIFGANVPNAKIAMTSPVTQQAGESIAMTAPVTQQSQNGAWKVRFTMPAAYTLATLPKPKDDKVRLIAVPARRMAVLTFSGLATDADLAAQSEKLAGILSVKGLRPVGVPTFAYYDPPWTLPFLRRNEVMWDVK